MQEHAMEKKVHKKKVAAKLTPMKMESVIKIKNSVEPNSQNAKRGKKRKLEEIQVAAKDNLVLAFHFSDPTDTNQIRKFLNASEILFKDMTFFSKKRICYVEVANKEMLSKALNLSGSEISGVSVLIHEAQYKPAGPYLCKRMKLDASTNDRRLILKNLPHNLSIDELRKHFSTAVAMKLPREPDNTKRFKSYGFLEFQDGEAANRIYEKMQGLIINGCAIKLDKILDKEQLPKTAEGDKVSTCLLVKQLPFVATSEMLKSVFPESKGIRVIHDPKTKKSRGFAFVEFNNTEDAQRAMSMMQGKEFQGRRMDISVANKKRRTARKARQTSNSKPEEITSPESVE